MHCLDIKCEAFRNSKMCKLSAQFWDKLIEIYKGLHSFLLFFKIAIKTVHYFNYYFGLWQEAAPQRFLPIQAGYS